MFDWVFKMKYRFLFPVAFVWPFLCCLLPIPLTESYVGNFYTKTEIDLLPSSSPPGPDSKVSYGFGFFKMRKITI